MKKTTNAVFVLLIIILTISLIVIGSTGERSMPTLSILSTWAGSVIAAFSAIILLVRTLDDRELEKLIPVTLPLLAGVLIASQHWAPAAAIAALSIAFLVSKMPFNALSNGEGKSWKKGEPSANLALRIEFRMFAGKNLRRNFRRVFAASR